MPCWLPRSYSYLEPMLACWSEQARNVADFPMSGLPIPGPRAPKHEPHSLLKKPRP